MHECILGGKGARVGWMGLGEVELWIGNNLFPCILLLFIWYTVSCHICITFLNMLSFDLDIFLT